jgi:hypothetical protein
LDAGDGCLAETLKMARHPFFGKGIAHYSFHLLC